MNRNDIIERIQNLTDEQFSLLLTLYSQQSGESDPTDQALIQTSA
jgi:hypothetical protein